MLQAVLNRARFRGRALAGAAAVVALAAGAGIVLAVFAGSAAGGKEASVPSSGSPTAIDATHLPPLLTLPGENTVLRYDINCADPDDRAEAGCHGAGTVFVRAGSSGPFQALPLTFDAEAVEGPYFAEVPPSIAASREGFTRVPHHVGRQRPFPRQKPCV